jgi:hypothetical protein
MGFICLLPQYDLVSIGWDLDFTLGDFVVPRLRFLGENGVFDSKDFKSSWFLHPICAYSDGLTTLFHCLGALRTIAVPVCEDTNRGEA